MARSFRISSKQVMISLIQVIYSGPFAPLGGFKGDGKNQNETCHCQTMQSVPNLVKIGHIIRKLK